MEAVATEEGATLEAATKAVARVEVLRAVVVRVVLVTVMVVSVVASVVASMVVRVAVATVEVRAVVVMVGAARAAATANLTLLEGQLVRRWVQRPWRRSRPLLRAGGKLRLREARSHLLIRRRRAVLLAGLVRHLLLHREHLLLVETRLLVLVISHVLALRWRGRRRSAWSFLVRHPCRRTPFLRGKRRARQGRGVN